MSENFFTNLKDAAVNTCSFTGQMVVNAQSLVVQTLQVTGQSVIDTVKSPFSSIGPQNVEQLSKEIEIIRLYYKFVVRSSVDFNKYNNGDFKDYQKGQPSNWSYRKSHTTR